MTLDWAEAGALVREAEAAGVRFCVSQNYRYTAEVRALRQAIESGHYGRPHLIDLVNHRHRPFPRTLDYPGAMVWDMACHHFDNLIHLFGPLARATAATHSAPWSPYRHDAGLTAALEFTSGPVCSYLLTHQATVPDYRWTLQSEAGMLRNRGEGGWEWVGRGPVEQFAPGRPPEPVPGVAPLRSEQGVVDDWLAWIEGGAEPGISGRQNLETLAACEMVLRSAASRRAVERGRDRLLVQRLDDRPEHGVRDPGGLHAGVGGVDPGVAEGRLPDHLAHRLPGGSLASGYQPVTYAPSKGLDGRPAASITVWSTLPRTVPVPTSGGPPGRGGRSP